MKIVYILKKGFQYFPPCLMHVLFLNDLGIDLEVYHGQNTDTINNILDKRNILHHEFSKDFQSKNRFESAMNFLRLIPEIRKTLKNTNENNILWIGNCETAIALGKNFLKNRRFILTTLELHEKKSFIGININQFIRLAEIVVSCEPHRAAIMKSWYNLKKIPYVIPNKAYEMSENIPPNVQILEEMNKYKNKFIIIYQGLITPDRPLEIIAKALDTINNPNVYFFVLGKYPDGYDKKIKKAYKNTVFWGYIPAPNHLLITQICHMGIANYDTSCLNNVFCAPNKIFEYSKYNLPMLASENIGLVETVGKYKAGECVDFNDVSCIVSGLEKIIENYEQYKKGTTELYNSVDNKSTIQKILEKLGIK